MKCPSCNLNIGVIKSAKFTISLALRKSKPCPHCDATIYQQTNPTWEYFKLINFIIFWFGLFLFLLAMIFGGQVGYETALIICFWLWIIVINTTKRSKRASRTRSTQSLEWNTMDLANRGTLEGSTTTVSAIPDMPSSVPAMDQTRCFPTNYPGIGGRPVRTRKN